MLDIRQNEIIISTGQPVLKNFLAVAIGLTILLEKKLKNNII